MHHPTVRVLEVLNYILKNDVNHRLADLSRELAIPKSTLLPILQTLCEYGYISQNKMGEYCPGITLYSVGTRMRGRFPAMDYVRNKLKSIASALGETCYFGIRDGGFVQYLDKVQSDRSLSVLIDPGNRLPAYATGVGKALLTDTSPDELKKLYPDGLKPLTKNTITNFDVLSEQMTLAGIRGYAEETEESTEHIRCFAVPIRKYKKIVAAISVAIPVFRYQESEKDRIINILKDAASEISAITEQTDAVFQ